jgi:deoxyribodipyrimidine photo-lyase
VTKSQPKTTILWFRQDLRLDDHPALIAAINNGEKIVPVFIHDPAVPRPLGHVSRWWQINSLQNLQTRLRDLGSDLLYFEGDTQTSLNKIIAETAASCVFWMRSYDPASVDRDKQLKANLLENGIDAQSFAGNTLFEPWQVQNKSGLPFRVFSPFWRACKSLGNMRSPVLAPKSIPTFIPDTLASATDIPNVDVPDNMPALEDSFQPGEVAALKRLRYFLDGPIENYASNRDIPSIDGTSRLSPHLRWGEISALRIWAEVETYRQAGKVSDKDADKFIAEVGWREFSIQLLFHNPTLPTKAMQEKFESFPWQENPQRLEKWSWGKTGYPMVDAGMRELQQTGYMHNRVRMVVASFLVKHLMLHWREGEAWFWDLLVDADPANNVASWQWTAGCGADAAPYFRIFNPTTQAVRFDPEGTYIKKYVPELAKLPMKYFFEPWTAPEEILRSADIVLGDTYPKPIVNHEHARDMALSAFKSLSPNAAE